MDVLSGGVRQTMSNVGAACRLPKDVAVAVAVENNRAQSVPGSSRALTMAARSAVWKMSASWVTQVSNGS